MAAIGFTTWRGQSSMAGGAVKPIPEAPAGSLEALTTSAGSGWVFLDAAALRKSGNVPSRVLGRFLSADWSAYFDGVVVIRDEVAPTLLPPG
jgi:erythromycin esterase-like protein